VTLLLAVPLFLASQLIDLLSRRAHGKAVVPTIATCTAIAVLVSLTAPVPTVAIGALVLLPGWLALWVVLAPLAKWRRTRSFEPSDSWENPAQGLRVALSSATARRDREVVPAQGDVMLRQAGAQPDAARDFLHCGAFGHWFHNGVFAARMGAWLAVVPVSLYVWDLLHSPDQLRSGNGLLVLTVAILLEFVRWLVAGFAFGALYAILPGRVGLLKSISFVVPWLSAALAGQLVAQWWSVPDVPWLYRFLQLFVFISALAVWYDLRTVAAGGGSWVQLRDLAGVVKYRELVTYIAPILVALAGLVEQASTGSGTAVATAAINSVNALFAGHG
jgi:hypothetical protein